MADKEHLSVVVCGHVDAGKSTTCGHLIFKQGGISAREMEKLNATAAEKGKSSFGFAYYLDTCKEERERGVTIQCNTKEFFTDKYHYTIVDAPGHKDYIKNMITGSATADVGLLLVPAEKGGFEAAIAKADPKAVLRRDRPVSMLVFFTCWVLNSSSLVLTRWTPVTGTRAVSTKSRMNSLRCFK
jgi:elongation factor 1-alpha